jgi:hypothetical protein
MPLFDNDSSGKYYAQSLYAMINNRGVKQIYTLLRMEIFCPLSRLHIFLKLLANNKTMTRDTWQRGEK